MIDALLAFAAEYLIYVVALFFAAYWVLVPRHKKIEIGLTAIVALPLAYGIARLLGLFINHQQPFAEYNYMPLVPHEIDNSFPSDHSAAAGVLASVVSLYNKYVGLFLWVLALGVAAGRVGAGLHYPIDAVVGLVLGGACAAVAFYSLHRIHPYFSARKHTGE
jgi:undecaprenyl-diphosphatase